MSGFPNDSKALSVLLGFQREIRAFIASSDQCNLSRASWWFYRSARSPGQAGSWPTDEELNALVQRLHARLARGRGHHDVCKKRARMRLSVAQVRVLLRDLLLVASGLRPSCLVDCCALTKELAGLLLGCLADEHELYHKWLEASQVRAVLLDGNVFFVNVDAFVREKMVTGLHYQMYVDVSASLDRPTRISNSSKAEASRLQAFAVWTVSACKELLPSTSQVLEMKRPSTLNATTLAGILLCYPCVYDMLVDGDEAVDEWSEQENCLALCPLFLLQTAALLPQQQLEIALHEFSVPQHLLEDCNDEEQEQELDLNAGEFTVAWLTFKGDAVEDEEQHYVAKKEGLLSSKLLRGLFGDTTMQCFEEMPGDTIPKEAFVCILALFYEGNTEDRISYIFNMYNIIFSGENSNNGEGFIAEKDYLYLLNYLEEYMPLPKQLYAAFEECMIPMAGLLSNSQFITWVRQYPDVMEFLAIHLPASPLPGSPISSIRTSEEFLANSDPLNNSPSCRNDPNRNPFRSSFDFIGGEDSGDEDSDGLYDSDHLTEMEMSQSSYRDSTSSMNGNDELTSILKEVGAVVQDENTERTNLMTPLDRQDEAKVELESLVRVASKRWEDTWAKLSVAVFLKLVMWGGAFCTSASYSFSSESQSTKKYVCGYLHKISDSKWGKKRSWHRRWFVLDRQRGVLSYYRHNPANHMPTSSSQGNIVHMADSPVPMGKGVAASSSSQQIEMKRQSFGSPTQAPLAPSGENDSSDYAGRLSGSKEAKEAESVVRNATTIEDSTNSGKQEQDQTPEQQTLLYLNEAHPWYRGALDLNMDNVSLLFEKNLARNAPTRYFFQVSTLSLHDIDSKRGVQYKTDFDLWTSAIAEAINRKDSHNGKANSGAPVLSHQQLYRQRLLQKQMEEQAAQQRESESAVADNDHDSPPPTLGRVSPGLHNEGEQNTQDVSPLSHPKRKIPPRIVTQFSSGPDSGVPDASCWHLHIHVDGTKQCLIVGFMLNIVAIRCLASEHVLWKVFVCLAVSGMFIASIYNPRPVHRHRHGSMGGSFTDLNGGIDSALLGTDIAQCSNPENCCLHKVASPTGPDGDSNENNCTEGSSDNPRRRCSGAGNRRFVKFPMGSTMTQCEMQANGRSSNVEHAWTTTRAETFTVRSSDYKKSRKKEPSKPALFGFIGADLVRTESKVDLISQRVEFPPEHENSRLFIINAQLPSYGPSVWGDGSYDGPGYSLALYWKIPDEIIEELKNPTTTTLKLFKRFLEAGDDTSLTDRFKVIAQVTNQDECGITGMAKKLLVSHNATPVLTRPQHRIYHFKDGTTEIVVDVHAFSYIARRGIHSLIDKTSRLVIDVAFVIQGETEEELPEQVLGCCRLDRVNVQKAVDLP
ncbi:hypothetical protein JG687_00005122 [Phytophthora cactorum]|uniref:PH domain-containing protein n=1 Tax=Phytophthora cactorum TaxID=29920 RepID=A0A8T1URF0_9STRA|nr:hypothetical protein JG687_00005122 [Phytophthora cactorum]